MRSVFLQCGNMISIHLTSVYNLWQRSVDSYAIICVKHDQLNAMLFLSSTIKDVEHRVAQIYTNYHMSVALCSILSPYIYIPTDIVHNSLTNELGSAKFTKGSASITQPLCASTMRPSSPSISSSVRSSPSFRT